MDKAKFPFFITDIIVEVEMMASKSFQGTLVSLSFGTDEAER